MEPFNDLGPQLSFYRSTSRRPGSALGWLVPGGLLVLTPLAYGLYQANSAYTQYGPAAADRWSRPWFIFSLGALVVFILLALRWVRSFNRSAAVHQAGLQLALPATTAFRWEQIAGIAAEMVQERFLGRGLRTRCHATIFPVTGKPLRLVGLQDLPALVAEVKDHLYPALLPAMQEGFDAGQWLHFGPVAVHRSGMKIRARLYAWPAIQGLNVRSGYLMVEFVDRPKLRLPVASIPNPELLFRIIAGIDLNPISP